MLVHQLWDMLPGLSDASVASAATAPVLTLLSRLVASPAAMPQHLTSLLPGSSATIIIKPEPGSDIEMQKEQDKEDKSVLLAAQQQQAIHTAVMADRLPRLFPFLRHPPSGVRLSTLQVGHVAPEESLPSCIVQQGCMHFAQLHANLHCVCVHIDRNACRMVSIN